MIGAKYTGFHQSYRSPQEYWESLPQPSADALKLQSAILTKPAKSKSTQRHSFICHGSILGNPIVTRDNWFWRMIYNIWSSV